MAAEPLVSCSLVLAADDPAALARFYAGLLGCEPIQGFNGNHWRVPWPGGGQLELYAPSRRRPIARGSGRLALCLRRGAGSTDPMAVLSTWVECTLPLGAALLEPARREAFGAEAWLQDPEGNRLLLLATAG